MKLAPTRAVPRAEARPGGLRSGRLDHVHRIAAAPSRESHRHARLAAPREDDEAALVPVASLLSAGETDSHMQIRVIRRYRRRRAHSAGARARVGRGARPGARGHARRRGALLGAARQARRRYPYTLRQARRGTIVAYSNPSGTKETIQGECRVYLGITPRGARPWRRFTSIAMASSTFVGASLRWVSIRRPSRRSAGPLTDRGSTRVYRLS
jgi:hypothetical protein